MKSKVIIIGTTPKTAGIGGVTIHIERLIYWLKAYNYPVDLCNYKILPYWKQIKIIAKYNILHIHVSNPILRFFYILISILLHKKCILTIHGDIGRFNWFKNLLDQLAIRFCTVPILINHKSYNIACKWNTQSVYIPAFLPPTDNGYLSESSEEKLKQLRSLNKIIFSTNASCRKINHKGEEVYGIDFLINYFNTHPQFIFIVSNASGEYEKYYQRHNIKLNNNIYIISERHSYIRVLQYTDIMIRNTQTDGDALSIKEALFLQKNVLASDCVDRPENVFLFKYNNIESFEKQMIHLKNILGTTPPIKKDNVTPQIITIYKSLEK